MKRSSRILSAGLAAALLLSLASCGTTPPDKPKDTPPPAATATPSAGIYTPGTYTGTGSGMDGDVVVAVTVDANAITKVEVTAHEETPGIGTKAVDELPAAIVAAGSTDVDDITSATVTSAAIKDAVNQALSIARGEAAPEASAKPTDAVLPFDQPDVIVIGLGFAGMNAAVAAADNGAKVLVLEKTGERGGCGRMAGGTLSGAGTKMQQEAGLTDTPELMVEEIVKRNANIGGAENYNEQLMWFYARNSGAAVDWLDSLGADMGDRKPAQPSLYEPMNVARVYTGDTKTYLDVVGKLLDEHIAKGDVAVLYNTNVTSLVMDGAAVAGVNAVDGSGKETVYHAPSTIMCTGGYGHNEALLNKYNFQNVLTSSPAFDTGDGFLFAEQAGGVLTNMNYCSTYAGAIRNPESGFTKTQNIRIKDFPYMIFVNKEGSRFVDELGSEDGSDYDSIVSWWKKGDNTVYVLFDQAMVDDLRARTDAPMPIISGDKDWSKWDAQVARGEEVFTGATIAEVAQKAGVDAQNLEATIKRYNGFVDTGKDADFGRTRLMQKFETGPYYIVRTIPYVMITSGGPWMNDQCQLLNKDGAPIAGLYQAGEIVGNSSVCGHTTFGGIQNTGCVVWGKQAGKNAAVNALGK